MITPLMQGSFIPTSFTFDVAQLRTVDINSAEFKELLVRLYQNITKMALAINDRKTDLFPLAEFSNGAMLFPDFAVNNNPNFRAGVTFTVNFGPLPNAGTTTVAHGLTPNSSWIMYKFTAVGSDTTGLNYIALPDANSTVKMTATNIVITTTANYSNYNKCTVILEYVKI